MYTTQNIPYRKLSTNNVYDTDYSLSQSAHQ